MREKDPSILQINFTQKTNEKGESRDYFYLTVDRSKLRTVAFEGIKEFLSKLHIYKSMGDFEAAKAMVAENEGKQFKPKLYWA